MIQRVVSFIPEFNPNMIVLFGSHVKGTEKESSDIDVAVIVDKIMADYLDIIFRLYKMRRKIDIKIGPHVFESGNDESGMLHEILTTGSILYQV